MGGIRDRLSKRYAARLGERWSSPPGEEGGAQGVFPRQSRQTARFRDAQPDFMPERPQRIILDATNLEPLIIYAVRTMLDNGRFQQSYGHDLWPGEPLQSY